MGLKSELSLFKPSGKINGVSYRIYFNSCNLEHVLFNELKDFTDNDGNRIKQKVDNA